MKLTESKSSSRRPARRPSRAFGDGDGVTVIAGGTIVMPELTTADSRPGAALLLVARAGLDGIARENGTTVRIGARRRSRASWRRARAARDVRAPRRRPRDPRAGDDRRQPLRAAGRRVAARRPAGAAARARRARPLGAAPAASATESIDEFLGRRPHGPARARDRGRRARAAAAHASPPPPARPLVHDPRGRRGRDVRRRPRRRRRRRAAGRARRASVERALADGVDDDGRGEDGSTTSSRRRRARLGVVPQKRLLPVLVARASGPGTEAGR